MDDGVFHMGLFRSSDSGLDYEPESDWVTEKRIKKMEDLLDEDERVQFMTVGSTIDVEGAGSGKSLFGNERSRKSGTRGYVRTAFTDDRIVVKIPQWTGSDQRKLTYDKILGVDLDTGLVSNRLTLQTAGPTWHIEINQPGKGECRNLVSFIETKIGEMSQQPETDVQEIDPTKQLQRLKELHDDGLVTDEEFEEKRAKLVEKI